MTMKFEFVDNNATIDRAARRRIRSHVAIGKNAGKKLIHTSRKSTSALRGSCATIFHVPKLAKVAPSSGCSNDRIPQIQRQFHDGLSVLSLPEQPALGSRRLVQRGIKSSLSLTVYSPAIYFLAELRHDPRLVGAIDTTASHQSMFVQFIFLDKAYYHCAMAVSITALNSIGIEQENPIEAMNHLSQAFRLVNERLSGNEAVSDATIAVVVVLSKFERMQGRQRQGLVHFEGLQRMVEVRGGMAQLARNVPGIAQKITRLDLEYSLELGSATRFSIEDITLGNTALFGLSSRSGTQDDPIFSKILDQKLSTQLSVKLENLLIDTTNFALLLNEARTGHREKILGYRFHDTVLLLGHILINISPMERLNSLDCLDKAVYLGLTGFIITLLPGLDRKIIENPLFGMLMRSTAQESSDKAQTAQKVLLWLLFIGRASTFGKCDDYWLIPKTAMTMQRLGLYLWEDVRETLAGFPWVGAVHDEAGSRLASAC